MSQEERSAAKPPCRFPLPDGRRCCECDACQGTSAAQDRAEGVIAALEREASRASEPWLTPTSLRVLAEDNRALLAENERLRDLVVRFRQWDDLPGRADGPYWMSEADKVLGDV